VDREPALPLSVLGDRLCAAEACTIGMARLGVPPLPTALSGEEEEED
jgi:hypothetical protein